MDIKDACYLSLPVYHQSEMIYATMMILLSEQYTLPYLVSLLLYDCS